MGIISVKFNYNYKTFKPKIFRTRRISAMDTKIGITKSLKDWN